MELGAMLDVGFQESPLFISCWVIRFCEGIGLFCGVIVVAPFSLQIVSITERDALRSRHIQSGWQIPSPEHWQMRTRNL